MDPYATSLSSTFSISSRRGDKSSFISPSSRQQLADYLVVERSGLSMELGKM